MGIFLNMESIDVSGNKLVGSLPSFLPELSFLRSYRSSNNTLSGSIPTFIGMVSMLEEFEVRY